MGYYYYSTRSYIEHFNMLVILAPLRGCDVRHAANMCVHILITPFITIITITRKYILYKYRYNYSTCSANQILVRHTTRIYCTVLFEQ